MNSTVLALFITTFLMLHSFFSNGQNVYEKNIFITQSGDTLPYRILYPEHYDPAKTYPLVLFLHGAGERGKDNEKQLTHGAGLFLQEKNRLEFPAIVVFPQCPPESYWASVRSERKEMPYVFHFDYSRPSTWPLEASVALVKKIRMEEGVDKDRIYLMGLSMGGMGTFEILARHEGLFAAAVPVCGGADLNYSEKLESTPLWIFHGENDKVVDVKNSREIYSKLKSGKGNVRYTEYPGVGHDSWNNAFAEPQLLPWMFSNRLK